MTVMRTASHDCHERRFSAVALNSRTVSSGTALANLNPDTFPQGWYDRKTFEVRTIVDIAFCGVMGPPGGGRSAVTNPAPSTLDLKRIP